jgi:hypothetical protein
MFLDAGRKGGGTSIFVSGIDPGWAVDLLPLVLSGVAGRIDEIRCREIFNYATYDQPDAVRNLIGFGRPLDETPPMLFPASLDLIWGAMVRTLADGLGVTLDEIRHVVERRPLERTIDTPEMGVFEQGMQGAFRFEVQGVVAGKAKIVCEHITRIDDDIAPDWPRPPAGQRGSYAVDHRGRSALRGRDHAPRRQRQPGRRRQCDRRRPDRERDPGGVRRAARRRRPLDLPLITGRGLL